MADRVVVRELINLIGVEVDSRAGATVSSFLQGIETGVNRAGKFFFFLGELLQGAAQVLDVTVGAFLRLVSGVARGADEMRLAAESAGVNTTSFQELAYAASTVGVEMTSVRAVLLEVAKGARLVGEGNEQAQKGFSRLGVSVRDVGGELKAPNQLLLDVAEALSRMPPGAERSALALDVLGAQGAKLLPVLAKGRAGLKQLADEGHALGLVLDEETIRAADDYQTELGKLEAAIQGLRNTVAGPFLKALTKLFIKLRELLVPLRGIIKTQAHNFVNLLGQAMDNSAKIAEALKTALVILAGVMLGRLLFALSTVTAAQIAWGSAALIAGARAAAAGALAAGGAVLALLPWLALGAAIILVAEEIASFFTGADSALKRFIKFLETEDPTDSTFMKGLKSAGALLFDITNPERWRRFWEAMTQFGQESIHAVIGMFQDLLAIFRELAPDRVFARVSALVEGREQPGFALPSMAARLGALSQQPAPMEALFGRGGSAATAMQSVAQSTVGPTVISPVFNLDQQVTAAPGQSAFEVGQSAARGARSMYEADLVNTLASLPR